jgi:hypothetical protein
MLTMLLAVAVLGCGGDGGAHNPYGTNTPDAGDTSASDVQGDSGGSDAGSDVGVEAGQDAVDPDVETPVEDAGDTAADAQDTDYDPGGECDPYLQDCPLDEGGNPQQCNPIAGVPTCIRENSRQRGEDEVCDGGDCAPGLTCIQWSDGRGRICTEMCDRNDGSGCVEDKECGAWMRSNDNIGLCRPPRDNCDIYGQDCPEGMACTFGLDPETMDPIFVCEAAGPNGVGDPCANGNGRCMAGSVCIRDDDTNSTCHEICRTDEGCSVEGQMCIGRSATWQVTFCR